MQALYQTISPGQRLVVTIVVMAATLMQVIDTTIINVALPHMQGSLSASSAEITWTLTAYLVSSAIFMPLTGYFSDRLGRKQYFIFSIVGFTLTSALCGISTSLTTMVFFRLLQGIFGAAIVPLSQAILTDIYSPAERGKAMAIWGIGVMVGPVIGPTLGGYLTEVLNWRWTFYVNIPVGIFTLLFIQAIPDTKRLKRDMDWLGMVTLSIFIGGLQFVLDRGNHEDWFQSSMICYISFLTVFGALSFVLHNLHEKPTRVFDIRIFKDRNFTLASLLLAIFGLGLYGVMVIQPLMMENLLNYPALTAGLILAPRGVSGLLSMMLVSRLIKKADPRVLIAVGVMFCVTGMWLGTRYTLDISPIWLIAPMILQGFGFGMIFVPLSIIAYSTLPIQNRTEAAGLYSLLRTLGGSIGISITITLFTRDAQLFWNHLIGWINPYNPSLYQYLKTNDLLNSQMTGLTYLIQELIRQANMVSFVNVYAFIMWCFIGMLPLLCFINYEKKSSPTSN